ncbi:hypothetical protein L204_103940 [Cryptococcus depauperatus]
MVRFEVSLFKVCVADSGFAKISYFLHKLVIPVSNKRIVKYGGSLENRRHLPLETTKRNLLKLAWILWICLLAETTCAKRFLWDPLLNCHSLNTSRRLFPIF